MEVDSEDKPKVTIEIHGEEEVWDWLTKAFANLDIEVNDWWVRQAI